MDIRDVINEIKVKSLEKRVQHLEEIEAPKVIIARTQEIIDNFKNKSYKINGQMKHKKIMDAEVISYEIKETTARYYSGNHKTLLVTMNTNKGKIFYDAYDNKIAICPYELIVC